MINNLSFIVLLTFIKQVYTIVLINGNRPKNPKLLNNKDRVIESKINITFEVFVSLSL